MAVTLTDLASGRVTGGEEMLNDLEYFVKRRGFPVEYASRLSDLANGLAKICEANPTHESGSLSYRDIEIILRAPDWSRIWISPNAGEDLRHRRSYYLVPLLETQFLGEQSLLLAEIRRAILDDRITDLFVVSHGWHRNYFAAVMVYDRLVSRLFALIKRERIVLQGAKPLVVALHWHSDPGQNGWVDLGGRRDRTSFLDNMHRIFESNPGVSEHDLLSDFEDLFVAMSLLSTPGNDPRQLLDVKFEELTKNLKRYHIRGSNTSHAPMTPKEWAEATDPELGDKISALWRCYAEAECRALLLDQDEDPNTFSSPLGAIGTLVRFIVAAMGLGFLLVPSRTFVEDRAKNLWDWSARWAPSSAAARNPWIDALRTLTSSYEFRAVGLVLVVLTVSIVTLYLGRGLRLLASRKVKGYSGDPTGQGSAKGFPLIQALAWAPLQIVFALPLILVCLVTWILRSSLALIGLPLLLFGTQLNDLMEATRGYPWWSWGAAWFTTCFLVASVVHGLKIEVNGLFSERAKDSGDRAVNVRDQLAAIARFPLNLARGTVARDSSFRNVLAAVDNQLAFFEYQRKGVDAGVDAGLFLRALLNADPKDGAAIPSDLKIHLVGHSFGGLVVSNAAREMRRTEGPANVNKFAQPARYRRRQRNHVIREIQTNLSAGAPYPIRPAWGHYAPRPPYSLTLLQAAIGSGWFRQEEWARNAPSGDPCGMRGALACVYSKYDTANGFWYPLANNGRMAAGFVGLTAPPTAATLGRGGTLAMINEPPPQITGVGGRPACLNIDASRLIYAGAVTTGGGHADIFKDDIIHLLWAVSRI